MEPICSAKGVTLNAERDSFISFSNSPYIGHRTGTAVDIYPALQEWNSPIESPIHGKVIFSKKIKMGIKREFPTEDFDYAIGIQPDEASNAIVRVLHCKPLVEIGDRVETSAVLGEAIRSRYFNYWTGPHAHVDVLDKQNFRRSTQSFKLEVSDQGVSSQHRDETGFLECQVRRITDDFVIGISKETITASAGRFFGHAGKSPTCTSFGIIDAGLPHYEFGGLYTNEVSNIDEHIIAWKSNIGRIKLQNTGFSTFSTNDQLEIFLDEIPVKGISCFLYSKYQLIKGQVPVYIIPQRYGSLSGKLNEGDSFSLTFSESISDFE